MQALAKAGCTVAHLDQSPQFLATQIMFIRWRRRKKQDVGPDGPWQMLCSTAELKCCGSAV